MSRILPTIVHLDADALFVAMGQALNPILRGKKVAVGGRFLSFCGYLALMTTSVA